MIRTIRKFVGSLTGARRPIFFVALFLICVIALSLGIYIQFFYRYADEDPLMLGINIEGKKTEEEIFVLKSNFENLFNNSIIINSENIRVDKIEVSNEIVYTCYDLQNKDENYYDVNAKIPIINVNSDTAKQMNAEIQNEFYAMANTVMRRKEENTIYNVNYAAFLNNDILSLVIKSSLKEQGKPEKVTIKTYNYNLATEKKVTIKELIEAKKAPEAAVQSIINEDIKRAYYNAKEIATEYGILYERDLSSNIYKVENAENFFLTQDGYVYIIYAYGNNEYTNDMDVVIF